MHKIVNDKAFSALSEFHTYLLSKVPQTDLGITTEKREEQGADHYLITWHIPGMSFRFADTVIRTEADKALGSDIMQLVESNDEILLYVHVDASYLYSLFKRSSVSKIIDMCGFKVWKPLTGTVPYEDIVLNAAGEVEVKIAEVSKKHDGV